MEPIELTVLEAIHTYEDISQRELSNTCGISLGMVNLLIKKFAQVGLIKIEQLNGKRVRYILTPNGFSVLSKKTIDYIARSYTAILKIKSHITDTLNRHYSDGEPVLIYGTRDEVYNVLMEVLKEQGRNHSHTDKPPQQTKYVHWDATHAEGIFLFTKMSTMLD